MSGQYDFKKEWEKTRGQLTKFSKEAMVVAKKGEKELMKFSRQSKLYVDVTAIKLKKDKLYYMAGKEYMQASVSEHATPKLTKFANEFEKMNREQVALERKIKTSKKNKQVMRYFLVLGIGFYMCLGGLSVTFAQQVPLNNVEIIVDEKRYESIHDYRRQQIKDALVNVLAAEKLQLFTEEELYEIIREVRNQQETERTLQKSDGFKNLLSDAQQQDQQASEENPLELSPSEMQEMLDSYYEDYEQAAPLLLDPNKVKSIIIEPSEADSEIMVSD